jgi:hypothetical protein
MLFYIPIEGGLREKGEKNMLIFLFFPPKAFPSHVVIIMMGNNIMGEEYFEPSLQFYVSNSRTQSQLVIFMNCLCRC